MDQAKTVNLTTRRNRLRTMNYEGENTFRFGYGVPELVRGIGLEEECVTRVAQVLICSHAPLIVLWCLSPGSLSSYTARIFCREQTGTVKMGKRKGWKASPMDERNAPEIVPQSVAAPFIVGAALFLITAAVNLEVPLYGVYAAGAGFGAGLTAVVFAAYIAALVPTLIVLGGISDRVGRKPTLLVGLGCAILRPP